MSYVEEIQSTFYLLAVVSSALAALLSEWS
jgi:hypothetical protein